MTFIEQIILALLWYVVGLPLSALLFVVCWLLSTAAKVLNYLESGLYDLNSLLNRLFKTAFNYYAKQRNR